MPDIRLNPYEASFPKNIHALLVSLTAALHRIPRDLGHQPAHHHTGYAIHGFNPAPDYPASHGCMRVPIVDAISIYGWLQIGDWVDVYY